MRKMNPAVKSVLAASLAIGAGTGIVVGLDVMIHGAIPTAVASNEMLSVGYEAPASQVTHNGHSAQFMNDSSFKSEGTIRVYTMGADASSSAHTGPFTIKFTLPTNWIDAHGTFLESNTIINTDDSFDGVMQRAKLELGDNNKTCILSVGGQGLEIGQQIIIDYTVRTTPISDLDETTFNTMLNQLDSLNMTRSFFEMGTDWSSPSYNKTITVNGQNNPSDVVKLAFGNTTPVSGEIVYTFTSNAANTKLTGLVLTGEASDAFDIVVDPFYQVTRANGNSAAGTTAQFNEATSFFEGDIARLPFQIKVKNDSTAVQRMQAQNKATLSSYIIVEGINDDIVAPEAQPVGAKPRESISAQIGFVQSKLEIQNLTLSGDIASTNTGPEATMGDEVIVNVPVKTTGYVHHGTLTIDLGTDAATDSVKITKVMAGDTATGQISQDGHHVDIDLHNLGDPNSIEQIPTYTYKVFVKCGNDETVYNKLHGKTISVNTAISILDQPVSQQAGTQFKIMAPSATIGSQVTDPSVHLSDDASLVYDDEMVCNLGDTSRFQVTFANTSNQVIKNVKIRDTLTAKTRSGESLPNERSCIDILPNTAVLRKISNGGGTTTVNATVTLVDMDSDGHPYQIIVEPTSPLNLGKGEFLVLQYDAKIGHINIAVSNSSMRGATITNAPEMENKNCASIPSTQSASVTVATAKLSVNLTANKEKISVGEHATYIMTVQSIEKWTTSISDEYAIGLHLTAMLDNLSHTYGYKYDISKAKLYHVNNGNLTVVPSNAYTVSWVEPDKDKDKDSNIQKEQFFTLDINTAKASAYKIRNVNKPTSAEAIQDVTASGESADAESDAPKVAVAHAEAVEQSDSVDVEAVAKKLEYGFIVTFDGTTESLRQGFAGSLDSNTDVLARADNAGYSMDSQVVSIVGDEIVAPVTGGDLDTSSYVGRKGRNVSNGTNGSSNGGTRQTQPGSLSPTGVDVPTSLGIFVAGIAGWAYTWYRKIRRR